MALHFLIIEPDPSAAQITCIGVERIVPDAVMSVVPNLEQGWLSIQRLHLDFMIIDPPPYSLSAGQLIQHLKQIDPQTQIIVLASSPTPTLRRTLLRLGADTYLAKPVTLATLMEAVQHALETLQQLRADQALPDTAAA